VDVERINAWEEETARRELARCCGSSAWVLRMMASRPFPDAASVLTAADSVWFSLSPDDWREAFAHHPRIGDVTELERRFASTAGWASSEQQGTRGAAREVLERLAAGNRAYEARFGFIFIICATGRQAQEMLAALEERLANDPGSELAVAAREQAKITRLRLEKL
jgi:2-oxo-4-hydroxy-4-carboxy-5-ureidoimidazoline decarboxylase